jgi:hypothetical protein
VSLSLAGLLLAIGGMAWWNQPPHIVAPVHPNDRHRQSWARITDVVGEVQLDGHEQPLLSGVLNRSCSSFGMKRRPPIYG